jgi:hypothetical protein
MPRSSPTEWALARSGARRSAVNGSRGWGGGRMRYRRGRWRRRVRDGRRRSHGRCRRSRRRCDDGFRCCDGRRGHGSTRRRWCDCRFGDHGNHRGCDRRRDSACGGLVTGSRLSCDGRLPQGEGADRRCHHTGDAESCRQGFCDPMTTRACAHVVPLFCSPTPSHVRAPLGGLFAPRVSRARYRRR